MDSQPVPKQERLAVFLLGTVQFVNILDFMMIMPLGPDFSVQLGIRASLLGLLGAAYAVAACGAGLLGAWVLDRFDRKKALLWALLGLILGTVAGGFAVGFKSMMASRLLAGLFGGPATSLAISALTDLVPIHRRGRAIGAVMGAFSVASVAGVPMGLWLARQGSFRTPFFAVSGLGVLVMFFIKAVLPPMTAHLSRKEVQCSLRELLQRKNVKWSLASVALSNIGAFAIIPNIAPYLIMNCGMPRTDLEYLYAIGGLCTFFSMRFVGRLVDGLGTQPVMIFTSILLSIVIGVGFLPGHNIVPIVVVFVGFLVSGTARNVCVGAASSRVGAANERARYQSIQSAVQHLASACGSSLGSLLLYETLDKRLGGIDKLSMISIVATLLMPLFIYQFEKAERNQQVRTSVE